MDLLGGLESRGNRRFQGGSCALLGDVGKWIWLGLLDCHDNYVFVVSEILAIVVWTMRSRDLEPCESMSVRISVVSRILLYTATVYEY
jgi:hypothetical protein